MFNQFPVVSGTVNRRHPDVSPCRPQAWRVSLSKKTSSLEVQRNLFFYKSITFLLHSYFKVFCPIGRALVFVEGCEGSGCHIFADSLFFLNVGIFGNTIYLLFCCCKDSEEKNVLCWILQNGSSEGGADSAGRGSDSGCECLVQLAQDRMIDS